MEIFIVDNGSIDSTPQKIKSIVQSYPTVVNPILLKRNIGTTRSRNMAIKQASGRYLVILDSDIKLLPGVIIGLRDALEQNSEIGLIVPRLIYPNGRHQKSTDVFPTLLHKAKRFFWLKRIEKSELPIHPEKGLSEVDYAISALWMMPHSIIDCVGLLDENIFYSPEDVDYCLRIWKAGRCIMLNSMQVAIHDAQEISRGIRIGKSTFMHTIGLFYFFWKHRYVFQSPKRKTLSNLKTKDDKYNG